MIRMNGKETDYNPGISMREAGERYYAGFNFGTFDDFMVIVNNKAISSSEAEEYNLVDNDNIFLMPKLDGG